MGPHITQCPLSSKNNINLLNFDFEGGAREFLDSGSQKDIIAWSSDFMKMARRMELLNKRWRAD